MKKQRSWSNAEMRALTRGESMAHYARGQHYYVNSDWYVWFFGNPTRYSIFHTFLWKYGNGEMVSYTDLTQTKKIGSVKLKIDSIKSTIREGLALGFIDAYKAENDRRVTMYSFNRKILPEITDYCFMMRRNRMWESASFISNYSSNSINNKLVQAGMKEEWVDSINNFIEKMGLTFKAKFGTNELPNVISIKK